MAMTAVFLAYRVGPNLPARVKHPRLVVSVRALCEHERLAIDEFTGRGRQLEPWELSGQPCDVAGGSFS
jgi:hypothetical protein